MGETVAPAELLRERASENDGLTVNDLRGATQLASPTFRELPSPTQPPFLEKRRATPKEAAAALQRRRRP